MIIKNIKKLYHTMVEYYLLRDDYCIENDPTFTYQELCLFDNVKRMQISYDEIDTDEMYDCMDRWEHHFIAHFTNPPIIDKPWDQVLQDRRSCPPNIIKKDDGTINIWYAESPYREIFEEERKKIKELHDLHVNQKRGEK